MKRERLRVVISPKKKEHNDSAIEESLEEAGGVLMEKLVYGFPKTARIRGHK